MFKRRTLFIVGAGASAEVNLPTGSELALEISKKMDIRFGDFGTKHVGQGDIDLFEDLVRTDQRDYDRTHIMQDIQSACWLIRDGIQLSASIDDFLELHTDNETATRVGKCALVKCILEAERKSLLYFDGRDPKNKMDFIGLRDTWLNRIMQMLSRAVPRSRSDTIFNNIEFIVFNYDRCIEFFLFNALQSLYGMPEHDALEIMKRLKIHHPYGVVGDLLFAPNKMPFGSETSGRVARLSESILTYSEQLSDDLLKTNILEALANAEKSSSLVLPITLKTWSFYPAGR